MFAINFLFPVLFCLLFTIDAAATGMWYDDVPIQERLDNVRAARTLFFELDDIYKSYKRDFDKKDATQIALDKKKFRSIVDRLEKIPGSKSGAGDIDYECRSIYSSLSVWIRDITGNETYSFVPNDLKYMVTKDYKKQLRQKREDDFITTNTHCINLMNKKEENFLKQLGKKQPPTAR